MQTVNITISKDALMKSVESLLWKYGRTIEGADNYRQVFNVQSEHGAHPVDEKVLSDSFSRRSKEAIDLMREFFTGNINYDTDGSPAFVLNMPERWIGKEALLQAAVNRYVEDGMMSDWLNVTAPNETAIYTTRLTQDSTDITVELYKKGRPL